MNAADALRAMKTRPRDFTLPELRVLRGWAPAGNRAPLQALALRSKLDRMITETAGR